MRYSTLPPFASWLLATTGIAFLSSQPLAAPQVDASVTSCQVIGPESAPTTAPQPSTDAAGQFRLPPATEEVPAVKDQQPALPPDDGAEEPPEVPFGDVSEQLPEEAPEEGSEEAPEEAPEQLPEKAPEKAPEKLPESKPEAASGAAKPTPQSEAKQPSLHADALPIGTPLGRPSLPAADNEGAALPPDNSPVPANQPPIIAPPAIPQAPVASAPVAASPALPTTSRAPKPASEKPAQHFGTVSVQYLNATTGQVLAATAQIGISGQPLTIAHAAILGPYFAQGYRVEAAETLMSAVFPRGHQRYRVSLTPPQISAFERQPPISLNSLPTVTTEALSRPGGAESAALLAAYWQALAGTINLSH